MKKFLKSQKGIGGSDALVAISILVLFVGLISTLSYNIYLASTGIKRRAVAMEYIKDIFAYAEKNYYEDIDVTSIYGYITENQVLSNSGKNKINVSLNEEETLENSVQGKSAYTINVNIEKLNMQEAHLDKLDLIMKVTVQIEYKVGNKNTTLEMYTIKEKEKILVPNKPDLTLLTRQSDDNIYPIKKERGVWKITTVADTEWYNYFLGNWATVLVSKNKTLKKGDIIENLSTNESVYLWIPKYMYPLEESKIQDLKFLYRNTLKYVSDLKYVSEYNNSLIDMPEDFIEIFDKNGHWMEEYDGIEEGTNCEYYNYLNEKYPIKNSFIY